MRFSDVSSVPRRDEAIFHAHRFLLRAGLAIGNVFGWIFVFEYFFLLSSSLGRALAGTLLMYALSQLITVVLTPLAAAHLSRGTRRMLVWAVVLAAGAFVILGATLGGFFDETPVAWGIGAFAVFMGAYRALYFIPYSLNRADTEKARPQGRALFEVLLALIPAFAGATLVLEAYAPLRLLFGAALFAGVSALPLFLIPDIHERFSFSYLETFRELFSPRNRRIFWTSFLEGVQGAALFLIWPLAVFLIVGWSYMLLGVIFTITLLLVMLFRILYKKYLPSTGVRYSPPVHVVLAMSGWIARLAAGTPLTVIIADSYAYAGHTPRGTLTDAFSFEQAADRGSFIDESTVLKELALAGGRIALVVIVGLCVLATPLVVAFGAAIVLAALAAGISVFLAHKSHIPAY